MACEEARASSSEPVCAKNRGVEEIASASAKARDEENAVDEYRGDSGEAWAGCEFEGMSCEQENDENVLQKAVTGFGDDVGSAMDHAASIALRHVPTSRARESDDGEKVENGEANSPGRAAAVQSAIFRPCPRRRRSCSYSPRSLIGLSISTSLSIAISTCLFLVVPALR